MSDIPSHSYVCVQSCNRRGDYKAARGTRVRITNNQGLKNDDNTDSQRFAAKSQWH